MKIDYQEYEDGVSIELIPDTPEEVAQLFRFVNNAKKVKPDISLSFYKLPTCAIYLKKVARSKQNYSIYK